MSAGTTIAQKAATVPSNPNIPIKRSAHIPNKQVDLVALELIHFNISNNIVYFA